ncbi:MAG TPA: HlyD family efflux transporter periplasmic adaptor subunit [Terriglobales bacterium]|nr:HlyD family efflux transporter periplasmic adaptor subunit [Terriglobales bacterium]
MNLAEALNVALPELPAPSSQRRYPRLHPNLIAREHLEEGTPMIYAIVSGADEVYRLTPQQWQVAQLFNGQRSYEDIAGISNERLRAQYSADDIHEFASTLEKVWYRPPQESNVTCAQKGAEERHKHAARKSKLGDLTMIFVAHWDPDHYLTWLHGKISFVYGRWFTLLTLAFFAFTAYVFVDRWGELGTDTLHYYNFSQKGLGDLLEFWLLFCGLGFFHETAHGLTCKHFGGAAHKMGFLLYYLSPCFFVDVTEIYVYGGKWQRITVSIAGIWTELIICAAATVAWWGTPGGSSIHDFTYKIMLITGVGVIIINLNPLIKLDGYYILSELTGIVSLKERATAFVSGLVKRKLFRLPVDVEFVPRRRRLFFAIYALLSGLYSYTLLYVVVRFAYNVLKTYSPDWAFLPAALLAGLIFRSRIRTLVRFMKTVYLDKKEKLWGWLLGRRGLAVSAIVILLFFAPLFHETRSGRFILEPVRRATLRAVVPGEITSVLPVEGQAVAAGAPLVHMSNLELQQRAARVTSDLQVAIARAAESRFGYTDYAPLERQRQSLQQQNIQLAAQISALQLASPISGIVVTPRVRDLVGSYVQAGSDIMEVEDLSLLQARIYLPEFDVRGVNVGKTVSLKLAAAFQGVSAQVQGIAPAASPIGAGLVKEEAYKGLVVPQFYGVTALVSNPSHALRPGMTGTAKILVARRSAAGFVWQGLRDFVQRKVW